MNTSDRFFRRYIVSTVGSIVLFLVVNILLAASYFVVAYFGNVKSSNFPIEDFSRLITVTDSQFMVDTQAEELLNNANAWAMILDDNGNAVWEANMPEELPRHYSTTDVAMFSRWYLEDYPINIWKRADELLVIGLPPGSVVNHYFSFRTQYVWPTMLGLAAIFCFNALLMIYLVIRSTHRVEKAIGPILNGIHQLVDGKHIHLEENGELAEINISLNKAGDYLIRKDNTRAVWIRGISHDIRTPLSVILGYASEIEDNLSLPATTRKQAGIIRRYSEKLKNLVADLNLTTKLEYSMQSTQRQTIDPVELVRQVISDLLNDGLPDMYDLELSEDSSGNNILITGDPILLSRLLSNLILNCIIHNPDGCKIQISVGSTDTMCCFSIIDNGCGISEPLLKSLNNNEDISSSQKQTKEAEHGLGLKIVRQIVNVHQGDIQFSDTVPYGLTVNIFLPLKL